MSSLPAHSLSQAHGPSLARSRLHAAASPLRLRPRRPTTPHNKPSVRPTNLKKTTLVGFRSYVRILLVLEERTRGRPSSDPLFRFPPFSASEHGSTEFPSCLGDDHVEAAGTPPLYGCTRRHARCHQGTFPRTSPEGRSGSSQGADGNNNAFPSRFSFPSLNVAILLVLLAARWRTKIGSHNPFDIPADLALSLVICCKAPRRPGRGEDRGRASSSKAGFAARWASAALCVLHNTKTARGHLRRVHADLVVSLSYHLPAFSHFRVWG